MWFKAKSAVSALLRERYREWKRQGDLYVSHWLARWGQPPTHKT